MKPKLALKTRDDLPTWVYRACVGALLAIALWFMSGLLNDFKGFGTALEKLREDFSSVKGDVSTIKKDTERLDKGQQRADEKAERFERDVQKKFERIEEKIDRKADKK